MSEKTYLASQRLGGVEPAESRRTLDTLATVLILMLALGILYFAREILVPIAIAVLLSFALSPLVKLLRRLGLGKRLSVGIVVVATFLIAVGLGAILAKEVGELAADAPRLQAAVTRKVETVREFAVESPVLAKLNSAIADMQLPRREPGTPQGQPAPGAPAVPSGPTRVEIVSPPPGVLAVLQTAIGLAASPLATAAFVAIFIVFILMQREDLRNRFIRLAGSGDLQRTTLAMNDAARRLSRYLLVQVLLNTAFGAVVAGMLTLLGVPSPLLWGIVAAFLRFIPYIGSVGAAAFPLLLAAASSPGWALVGETALFFAVIELVVGQLVEPLVYGRHTGISPIAVVASATFWTWLWGPVGLVLSTPLTVCLVVMGRHIDRLSFLDVLLGDAPPLNQVELFYQRMLSGDPSEILDHAEAFMNAHSLLGYSDEIAMKGLLMAQCDVRRGVLDEARQLRIRDTMRDLADVLRERDEDATTAAERDGVEGLVDSDWARDGAVLCCAGRTPLDEAAAHLLADVLQEHGIGTRVEAADGLGRPDGIAGEEVAPRLVVLSLLDADLSVARARVAVRRLRRRLPTVPLLAAFWMSDDDEPRLHELSVMVRHDTCVSGLPQAVRFCVERAAPQLAETPLSARLTA